jgi:hypothetical protein
MHWLRLVDLYTRRWSTLTKVMAVNNISGLSNGSFDIMNRFR